MLEVIDRRRARQQTRDTADGLNYGGYGRLQGDFQRQEKTHVIHTIAADSEKLFPHLHLTDLFDLEDFRAS
jgi:hypothetical protein